MTTAKFKNDSSSSKQGDFYHYVVVLEKCFEAKDGDTIWVEQRGDVATADTAIEVKYHADENHHISDRHVDFWKTLKNWVENREVISEYDFLILFTTSDIRDDSKLSNWNQLSKTDKFAKIEEIKNDKVTDTIKRFVEIIFNFDSTYSKNDLLKILEKFSIADSQPVMKEKIKEVLGREFFTSYPAKNRKSFLDNLLGHVAGLGRDNPGNWKIDISSFNNFIARSAKFYTSDTSPVPDLYRSETTDSEAYEDYQFVKEIRKIELDNEVPNAINDYYRAQRTFIYMSENDQFLPDHLSHYQNEVILKDLHYIKSDCKLAIDDEKDLVQKVKQSKKCYFQAMKMPLKEIKGYEYNQDFVQRGTIHTIVDSKDNVFSWSYED